MHPIVIMSYDKSPAITKAVSILEEAGMEVVVLNTKTAKLVQFLGALAGEEDDAEEAPVSVEKTPADTDTPAEETPDEEDDSVAPLKTEAIVNSETVLVERVDGDEIVLHPSSIESGNEQKTKYTLNESEFAFWPDASNMAQVLLTIDDSEKYVKVKLGAPIDKPCLRIGKNWKE